MAVACIRKRVEEEIARCKRYVADALLLSLRETAQFFRTQLQFYDALHMHQPRPGLMVEVRT